MTTLEPPIKPAVRAVIVRGDRLLVLRKAGGRRGGEHFGLPGGSQELGETLAQALERECLEEIGARVTIRGLLLVADHFKPRNDNPSTVRQRLELIFRCDVPADYVAHSGPRPDKRQVGVAWVPLADVSSLPLYPVGLRAPLPRLARDDGANLYLGEIP